MAVSPPNVPLRVWVTVQVGVASQLVAKLRPDEGAGDGKVSPAGVVSLLYEVGLNVPFVRADVTLGRNPDAASLSVMVKLLTAFPSPCASDQMIRFRPLGLTRIMSMSPGLPWL